MPARSMIGVGLDKSSPLACAHWWMTFASAAWAGLSLFLASALRLWTRSITLPSVILFPSAQSLQPSSASIRCSAASSRSGR